MTDRVQFTTKLICAECHTQVADDERHTYLNCLRVKWERGGLTRQEMASLFQYAKAGEETISGRK